MIILSEAMNVNGSHPCFKERGCKTYIVGVIMSICDSTGDLFHFIVY